MPCIYLSLSSERKKAGALREAPSQCPLVFKAETAVSEINTNIPKRNVRFLQFPQDLADTDHRRVIRAKLLSNLRRARTAVGSPTAKIIAPQNNCTAFVTLRTANAIDNH